MLPNFIKTLILTWVPVRPWPWPGGFPVWFSWKIAARWPTREQRLRFPCIACLHKIFQGRAFCCAAFIYNIISMGRTHTCEWQAGPRAIERLIRPPKFMRVARRVHLFIFWPLHNVSPLCPANAAIFYWQPPSNVGHSVSTLSSARCTLCCCNNYMRCARVCILPSLSNIDNLACMCAHPKICCNNWAETDARENVGAAPGALHTTAIFFRFCIAWKRGRACKSIGNENVAGRCILCI